MENLILLWDGQNPDKKVIRYDLILIPYEKIQYNMKTTIIRMILFKFQYWYYKKICFPKVNGHNSRYHFSIVLYTKYQFHLFFTQNLNLHNVNSILHHLIKKYSALYHFWVQNNQFKIDLNTKIEYKLRTEMCNDIISRYLKKVMFCTILYQAVSFSYHYSWLKW